MHYNVHVHYKKAKCGATKRYTYINTQVHTSLLGLTLDCISRIYISVHVFIIVHYKDVLQITK